MQDNFFSNGYRLPDYGPILPPRSSSGFGFTLEDFLKPAPSSGTKSPSKADVEAARRKILEILGNAPEMKGPIEPIMPAYRTEDALKGGIGALLSGIFGGNQGLASFAQAYTGQKQNLANLKTQTEQQKIDHANQQAMQKYTQQLGLAQTELGYKNEDYQQAWDEFQRQQVKDERAEAAKTKQVDERKVLQDALTFARRGGDGRGYIQSFVARGELSMEAAGRILGELNEEEYNRRYDARSGAYDNSTKSVQGLQDRARSQGVGATIGALAMGKQAAKPVSKEEIFGEIRRLQELKAQIMGDVQSWRTWNGMETGEKDTKLVKLAEMLGQIEKRVKQLLQMATPMPELQPRR